MPQNIFISAGDLSGEIHAARLVTALKKLQPDCRVSAMGGENLKAVADKFLCNLVNLSAFGFLEPVKLYFKLRQIFDEKIKRAWQEQKPDKVILVDYYGFNIHVAEEAHNAGIPVYYYISPQVWASRPGRIKKLSRYVSKMLVILPFEEEIYRKAGVDTTFVGHPLLDIVPEPAQKTSLPATPCIGLFPGSRPSVLKKHLPLFDDVYKRIKKEVPCEIKLFGLETAKELYAGYSFPVVYHDEDYAERRKVDLAITVSGTVSLEHTLLGIPMIVVYRLARLNYLLAKMLVNIDSITMANILAGQKIVPELIQDDATPMNIIDHALGMLKNPEAYRKMRDYLLSVRKQLGNPGVSERAAQIIIE